MSHVVTVQTRVHDAAALAAACQRLGLAAPVQGTAQLYSGEAAGLIVHLPGWVYPVAIDLLTGAIRYDNYGERWGTQKELDLLIQAYAVERCRAEARRKGYQVTEQQLQDGTVKLQIVQGG